MMGVKVKVLLCGDCVTVVAGGTLVCGNVDETGFHRERMEALWSPVDLANMITGEHRGWQDGPACEGCGDGAAGVRYGGAVLDGV
jgi:hypothetical protein